MCLIPHTVNKKKYKQIQLSILLYKSNNKN